MRSIGKAPRRLVLACGNTLRGDDGVGWRIAEAVEKDSSLPGMEVVIAQQLTPELAEAVSRAETVIFIDCSAISSPGEVSVFPVEPASDTATSLTHNLNPSTLLALAQELYGALPRRAFAVTVGGKSFTLAEELTEPVSKAIPHAVDAIKRVLQDEPV